MDSAPTPPTTHWPIVRWWWLRGPFVDDDITRQLAGFAEHGFGGVELAWLDASWLTGDVREDRPEWLGEEWRRLVAFAADEAARLGLQLDVTLGSAWPFGGSIVGLADAAQTLDGPSPHRLIGSWESPATPPVLDHLSADATRRYAGAMMPAFAPALLPRPGAPRPAVFCDSFELDVEEIWTPGLDAEFIDRFGYDLRGADLDDPRVRYDHLAAVSDAFLDGFIRPFVDAARAADVDARVQCHGAPVDLLAAYAAVDVPESETLLFEPAHSRLAASAAALAGRPVTTCETFTCVYGFVGRPSMLPLQYWHRERFDDLKLVADAVFAEGVNRIVWHGAPYQQEGKNPEFYASVHVAPDGALWGPELADFNAYLARVSAFLQAGAPAHQVGVLLGVEDAFMGGRIPDGERTPGAGWRFELRDVRPPADLAGHHPLWVNGPFLGSAEVLDGGGLRVGETTVGALVVDVDYLEVDTLRRTLALAERGALVQLRRRPAPPGTKVPEGFDELVDALAARSVADLLVPPLIAGETVPPFWARQHDDGSVTLFMAHPACADVTYPLRYGQAQEMTRVDLDLVLRAPGGTPAVTRIIFEPGRSVTLRVTLDGLVEPVEP